MSNERLEVRFFLVLTVILTVAVGVRCERGGSDGDGDADGDADGDGDGDTDGDADGDPPPDGTGSPCERNGDCPSDVCFPVPGESDAVCTTSCGDESDCVAGWSCGPIGGISGDICQCPGRSSETCNGLDDDCDGRVDEGRGDEVGCAEGERCVDGTCACTFTECAGVCVDTSSDPENCGSCGVDCADEVAEGAACLSGECACPGEDSRACGGICVDVAADRENCGECGNGCDTDEVCNAGSCCVPDCSHGLWGESDGCGGRCCFYGCSGGECAPGEWAMICAGTFTMGSPPEEEARNDNETQHEVTLTGDFEIPSTEVTQAEFEALMGYNPSSFSGCGGDCPVEEVSWYEAAAYCNALSADAGLAECYDCTGSGASVTCEPSAEYASPYDCPGYRLPTEAEWEFAARAGTTTATYNGDLDNTRCSSTVLDPIAWYCGNSGESTHAVGSMAANDWGLYDMLGNVYEWCHDWFDENYPSGAVTDPWGPEAGSLRVIRGGSWGRDARYARAAFRGWFTPDGRYSSVGFRPVRSLP